MMQCNRGRLVEFYTVQTNCCPHRHMSGNQICVASWCYKNLSFRACYFWRGSKHSYLTVISHLLGYVHSKVEKQKER